MRQCTASPNNFHLHWVIPGLSKLILCLLFFLFVSMRQSYWGNPVWLIPLHHRVSGPFQKLLFPKLLMHYGAMQFLLCRNRPVEQDSSGAVPFPGQ